MMQRHCILKPEVSETQLRADLATYTNDLKRYEDAMDKAESDAMYEGWKALADNAFRQRNAILARLNGW